MSADSFIARSLIYWSIGVCVDIWDWVRRESFIWMLLVRIRWAVNYRKTFILVHGTRKLHTLLARTQALHIQLIDPSVYAMNFHGRTKTLAIPAKWIKRTDINRFECAIRAKLPAIRRVYPSLCTVLNFMIRFNAAIVSIARVRLAVIWIITDN